MQMQYRSLQYLRGIAAFLVVIAHATEYPIGQVQDVPFWTGRTGDLGVQIFFVISGFVITIVSGPTTFDPLTFAWRRFLRLAPLYWLCTTVLLIATLWAPALFKTTTAGPYDYLTSMLFIPHARIGEANHWSPLLKPGWTLNLEVFFYAVTATLCWCRFRRSRTVILSVILLTLVALSFFDTSRLGALGFYASRNLIAFVAGLWLAEAATRVRVAESRAGFVSLVTGLSAVAAVAAVYCVADDRLGGNLAIPAGILVVSAAFTIELSGQLPHWPGLRAVGDASYSLYLTHMFTAGLVWAILRRFADPMALPAHIAVVAITAIVGVAVAVVSYRVVELPFIRLSKATRRAGSAGPETKVVRGPAIPV